ncbi:protein of unknown function [Modestobacter italicus]|uniref:Uncharacterized protein n=1 Tax=Modestobacter italicus (strain DSM 44449 / CECT 9708 / BC 501) TaxID=2732864 RepID=I4ER74_MODI5|nr:protein of unknown function [Modestobacter marinus]
MRPAGPGSQPADSEGPAGRISVSASVARVELGDDAMGVLPDITSGYGAGSMRRASPAMSPTGRICA